MKKKFKFALSDHHITRITNWFAAIVVLILVIWGIRKILENRGYEYTNDAQVTEYISPVISRVGGFIVDVKYVDNQAVKKGDTLLIIDSKEYHYEEDQQEALLDREEANIAVLNSQKEIQRLKNESIVRKIEAQKAKVWKQELELERYRTLHEQHSSTAQKLETVQSEWQVMKNELSALEQELLAGQAALEDLDVKKKVNEAEKKRLSAAKGRRELDINYTVITAPYNGRMGKRSVEVGQMINPGEVLGFLVNDETPTWVVANYKETQVRHIQVNDKVEIVADAFPDQKFTGKVISLAPGTGSAFSLLPPDNATGNYVKIVQRIPVRIELDDKNAREYLRSGMNVNVWIPKE